MYIKVGKNRIGLSGVKWYRMYHKKDNRVVGQKGSFYFANYNDFNPVLAQTQEYLDRYEFQPLNPVNIKLVPVDLDDLYEEAQACLLARIKEINKEQAMNKFQLGGYALLQGHLGRSYAYLLEAVEMDPENETYKEWLGRVQEMSNKAA